MEFRITFRLSNRNSLLGTVAVRMGAWVGLNLEIGAVALFAGAVASLVVASFVAAS